MNKNRLLIFLIAGLLISNILLVLFIMKGKRHGPGHGPGPEGPPQHKPSPREVVIERLHFDETQVAKYETLIQKHRSDVKDTEKALMELKTNLYNNLKNTENKTLSDSLINSIIALQNKLEHIHYAHFEDIKKLCTPEQLNNFNELANDLARIFGPAPPHGPGGPPPHHGPGGPHPPHGPGGPPPPHHEKH